MGFTKDEIKAVWLKAAPAGKNDKFKKDLAGAWMNRDKYGDTNDSEGWEIDHIFPEKKGGDNSLNNLQAMQWENNRSKVDDYPKFETNITASGMRNVRFIEVWVHRIKKGA